MKGNNEQEKWDNIVEACKKASEQVLRKMKSNKKVKVVDNPQVKKLSDEQKKIRLDMNSTDDHDRRKEIQMEQNNKIKEVAKKIQEI